MMIVLLTVVDYLANFLMHVPTDLLLPAVVLLHHIVVEVLLTSSRHYYYYLQFFVYFLKYQVCFVLMHTHCYKNGKRMIMVKANYLLQHL